MMVVVQRQFGELFHSRQKREEVQEPMLGLVRKFEKEDEEEEEGVDLRRK